jgi:hypothetical protein
MGAEGSKKDSENLSDILSGDGPLLYDIERDMDEVIEEEGLEREDVVIELTYDTRGEAPILNYKVNYNGEILNEKDSWEFKEIDHTNFEECIWPLLQRYFDSDIFSDTDITFLEVGDHSY